MKIIIVNKFAYYNYSLLVLHVKKKVMKITATQWIEIVKLIATFVIGVITTLFVHSCTLSLSVSKNNTNSGQKTEQVSTSSVDSTHININSKY
nr:MAG TPA: hypothetical protein [Microviridae sp.]